MMPVKVDLALDSQKPRSPSTGAGLLCGQNLAWVDHGGNGSTWLDGPDAAPAPFSLTATTVNV